MSPGVAIATVVVLVAVGGEVANLMTGVAMGSSFQVVGVVGMDMAHVATHGAEVVHVDDWWGGRTCGGVLELRRAEGEVDKHAGGRGVDCRRVVQCKTLVSGVMTFPCFPPYLLQIVS